MISLFSGCKSLCYLPDISKWKTDNLYSMDHLFSSCSSLIRSPGISKWNTNNVESIDFMFEYCSKIIPLPDISKWNVSNLTTPNSIFIGCSSLINIPDISNWKFKNEENEEFKNILSSNKSDTLNESSYNIINKISTSSKISFLNDNESFSGFSWNEIPRTKILEDLISKYRPNDEYYENFFI